MNIDMDIEKYTDKVLDKISKSGLKSLNPEEKYFLDSYECGEEDKAFNIINIGEYDNVLGNIKIKFIYDTSSFNEYGLEHFGKLLISKDRDLYEFDGSILGYSDDIVTCFENDNFNDWSLLGGFEDEYENWIISIVERIERVY